MRSIVWTADALRRTSPRLNALATVAVLSACSGPTPSSTEVPPFDAPVASKSGNLTITMTSTPHDVPVRGKNQLKFEIREAETAVEVDGLELEMVPFMPAMGHGGPTLPAITPLGEGRYLFDDVSLPMPGLWELRTTISGSHSDSVVPLVEVE